MKLILVRHAEAVRLGEGGADTDFDRYLTDLGKRQAAALAGALKAHEVRPDVVLTSPLVRAVQTADPIADALTPGRPPVLTDRLAAGELKPRKLSKAVTEAGGDVLVLVGHQPDLGEYAGWLLGAGEEAIGFEKGAAACLTFEYQVSKGAGTLEWLVPPGWFLAGENAVSGTA